MSASIASSSQRRSKQLVDVSAPSRIYDAVELEGDFAAPAPLADALVSDAEPSNEGLGGVFVLLPADSSVDAEDESVLPRPRDAAVRALMEFSHASAAAGVDVAAILEAATRSLQQFAVDSRLPESEAVFLDTHGDVTPETSRGLVQVKAEQAARDAARFVDTDEVASLLNIDASRVRHRKGAGILISHKFGKDLRYPTWQFTTGGNVIPGLAELRAAIDPQRHPADVAAIMMTPQEDLVVRGRPATPAQWLASGGDVRPVVDLLTDDIAW